MAVGFLKQAQVDQHPNMFLEEGHLRWDSLGEFLALGVSLEFYGEKNKNKKAQLLGDALDSATEKFLLNDKSPSRKVWELDTRGSHFYLAMYWAEALANQNKDQDLRTIFSKVASNLKEQESKILEELKNAQGASQNIGGYYLPNTKLVVKAMRPSETLNGILASI